MPMPLSTYSELLEYKFSPTTSRYSTTERERVPASYTARRTPHATRSTPTILLPDSTLINRLEQSVKNGIDNLCSDVEFPSREEHSVHSVETSFSYYIDDPTCLFDNLTYRLLAMVKPIFLSHGYEVTLSHDDTSCVPCRSKDQNSFNLVITTTPSDASHIISIRIRRFNDLVESAIRDDLFRVGGRIDCTTAAKGAQAEARELAMQMCLPLTKATPAPRRFSVLFGGAGYVLAELVKSHVGSTLLVSPTFALCDEPTISLDGYSEPNPHPSFQSGTFLSHMVALICHQLPSFEVAQFVPPVSPPMPKLELGQTMPLVVQEAVSEMEKEKYKSFNAEDNDDEPIVAVSAPLTLCVRAKGERSVIFSFDKKDAIAISSPATQVEFVGQPRRNLSVPKFSPFLFATSLPQHLINHFMEKASSDKMQWICDISSTIEHFPSSPFSSSSDASTSPLTLRLTGMAGKDSAGHVWKVDPASSASISSRPLVVKLTTTRLMWSIVRESFFYEQVLPLLDDETKKHVPKYFGTFRVDHGGYYGILLEDIGSEPLSDYDAADREERVQANEAFKILKRAGIDQGGPYMRNVLKAKDGTFKVIDFEKATLIDGRCEVKKQAEGEVE